MEDPEGHTDPEDDAGTGDEPAVPGELAECGFDIVAVGRADGGAA
jgi:hypothetical protein